MATDKAAFFADREKLMPQVAENLVPAEDLGEIDNIDEMLDEHREERRQGEFLLVAPDQRQTVAATNTDHDAMEGWVIGLHFTLAGDFDSQVVGHFRSRMFAVFDHLRHGCLGTFRDIEHAVADDVDILLAFSAQIGISDQTAAATLLQGCGIFVDLGTLGTSSPDDGAGFIANDLIIFFVDDVTIINFIDASFEDDLDAHLLEAALGFGRQFRGQGRYHAIEHVDLDDADFVPLNFKLLCQGITPFRQFASHFDTGETGASHIEGQQALLLDRIGLIHGFFEHLGGVSAQAHRIVIGPELVAVLFGARDAVIGRLRTSSHDQVIIWVDTQFAGQGLLLIVDRADLVGDNFDLAAGENLAQADADAVLVDPIRRHFMQFRHHGVVAVLVDQGDLDTVILFEPFGQFFSR